MCGLKKHFVIEIPAGGPLWRLTAEMACSSLVRNINGRAVIRGEGIEDDKSKSISYTRIRVTRARNCDSKSPTLVDRIWIQEPQARMPKDQTGTTPFSPGPGCQGSIEIVELACLFFPQNWHKVPQANFHISNSVFPAKGTGVPCKCKCLEARQIVSAVKIWRTDLERGLKEWSNEEVSR
jgi:hypothetical protein